MMLIKGARLIDPDSGTDGLRDILIDHARIFKILPVGEGERFVSSLATADAKATQIIEAEGLIAAPGLVDCHVHFRDPGFEYKEDIHTGARAAAAGGFTTVVMMGNTKPHMDNLDTIHYVLEKGAETGIHVLTCANVTKDMGGKELTDMDALNSETALFTDDGVPVLDDDLMRQACQKAAILGKVVSLHEENPAYIKQNGINAGEAAHKLGLEGSDRQAEISMVERDIRIAIETGADITVQHISAAESVDLIRKARLEHSNIHAEATPHHFTLTEDAVLEHGTLAKMNPPLRLESDRMAIIEGLRDGTIEMIATDHAPHSVEEKSREFAKAPSGIIGLETSLALGIKSLVVPGYLTMMQLIDRMSLGSAKVYGLDAGRIYEGGRADLVLFSADEMWTYQKENRKSKAENSPFFGCELPGKIYATIADGNIVYANK